MKFAIANHMIPCKDYKEKFEKILNWGFEGIELIFFEDKKIIDIKNEIVEIKKLLSNNSIKVVSMVYAHKYMQNLCDDNKDLRKKSMNLTKEIIEIASELKCGVAIGPEYRAISPLPLFSFHDPTYGGKYNLLINQLKELTDHAGKFDVKLNIEPINRYESTYYHTLNETVKICSEINSGSVGIIADFFHMNIEEEDIAKSLNNAKDYLNHIHLGDSNRLLPGYGHINFIQGLKVLRDIGYDGFYSFECSVSGDVAGELIKSMKYLRSCYNIANFKNL